MNRETLKDIEIPQELLELIPGFLERRKNEVALLKDVVRDHDFGVLAKCAHKIKGHGAAYGFEKISTFGRELEAVAELECSEQSKEIVDRYGIYVDFVILNMDQLLEAS